MVFTRPDTSSDLDSKNIWNFFAEEDEEEETSDEDSQ